MSEHFRQEIDPTADFRSFLVEMSENNTGGLTVLMELMKDLDGIFYICLLDEMNIRGTQIWVAYKKHAKQSIETLKDSIKKKDGEMLRVVNEFGRAGNHPWRAVHKRQKGVFDLLEESDA